MVKILILLIITISTNVYSNVNVIGFIDKADGLGSLASECINILKDNVKVNFFSTRYKNKNLNIKEIENSINLFFDALWYKKNESGDRKYFECMPKGLINIAYSMLESTNIPKEWIKALNEKFDAVLVPDKFYVKVYINAGISIPIFVFPHGINLKKYLNNNFKKKQNQIFTFGCTSVLSDRKNQKKLIKAFAKIFGNNKDVCLKIHARRTEFNVEKFEQLIKLLNVNNIEITVKVFDEKKYIDFLQSLDCLILISKGEGYSMVPRQALALGIPCILTDNTAQKTICNTNLVRPIRSLIYEKAYYNEFADFCGYNFNCSTKSICNALRNVYEDYPLYLKKANYAKKWAIKFDYQNLKPYYLTLVKPKKVILSNYNIIKEDIILTDSINLYKKYKQIINEN